MENNKNKIIICRCEDVTKEEIEEVIKEGFFGIDEIKRLKRVTMGPCQGRTCKKLILNLIKEKKGNLDGIDFARIRAPIKGVLIETIENECE